jgi:hypothetical protein
MSRRAEPALAFAGQGAADHQKAASHRHKHGHNGGGVSALGESPRGAEANRRGQGSYTHWIKSAGPGLRFGATPLGACLARQLPVFSVSTRLRAGNRCRLERKLHQPGS